MKRIFTLLMVMLGLGIAPAVQAEGQQETKEIKKVLVMGDSMSGWLGERLNAYGEKNGFQVDILVWDGSTVKKWASSPNLKSVIDKHNPDAVVISLGMNDLFETNPEKMMGASVDKILAAVGNRKLLWVGPPTWPGKGAGKGGVLNEWLKKKVGAGNYFNSFPLKIARQSATNPHPTRQGSINWMDEIVEWIPENSNLHFRSLDKPAGSAMSRGKNFTYKKMKEAL